MKRLFTCGVIKSVLYNASSSGYFGRQKKNQAIKGIAETLETNEEVVLKKMNSLRSYYDQLRQLDDNLTRKSTSNNMKRSQSIIAIVEASEAPWSK